MENSDNVVAGQNAKATDYNNLRADVIGLPWDFSRQALINGSFDIWQRLTTKTGPSNGEFVADRWKVLNSPDGGTLPTLTHSQQAHTPGDEYNSYYLYRIATNGAGSGYGANAEYGLEQRIERGTRYLCGNGKKVTVTIRAKSNIAGKKMGVYLKQNYGQGGTPTSEETINGASFTLTSSWASYTATITTNTLVGKTFGTDLYNVDYLSLVLSFLWGSTAKSKVGAAAAETFVGSGNIEIAYIVLNVGDEAMTFRPQSHQAELLACRRYYQKSYNLGTDPGTAIAGGHYFLPGVAPSGGGYIGSTIYFQPPMRTAPTFNVYDKAGSLNVVTGMANNTAETNGLGQFLMDQTNANCIRILFSNASYVGFTFHWTAEAEL